MESFALIIFGITSNLAQIKLIPALYDMEVSGLLPDDMIVVGIARKVLRKTEFKAYIEHTLRAKNRHHAHAIDSDIMEKLVGRFQYVQGEAADEMFYSTLHHHLDQQQKAGKACHNRIFYLATYPDLYQVIFENLQKSGLGKQDTGWVRLMIEKPIGNDLKSAQDLNRMLHRYFDEDQIYRLDHYLGKETLQNIITFRFANDFVEPLLNHEHIDHIQITTAEDFGIGARGGYFDSVGSLKDVGQNHNLQMIAFATMDAPAEFSNQAITDKRLHVLQNLVPDPKSLVLGQYKGYTNEPNVDPHSTKDTFFAFKTELDVPRLKGVPMYVRGGKYLAGDADEISIVFKPHPTSLLKDGHESSVLIFRLEPNEAIVFKILTKKPGHQLKLEPAYMQYCYRHTAKDLPDPYEKLIADAMRGDQTFFNDSDEVEAQWEFIDKLLTQAPPVIPYERGSWGPGESDKMIRADGRAWLEPSMAFCQI